MSSEAVARAKERARGFGHDDDELPDANGIFQQMRDALRDDSEVDQ